MRDEASSRCSSARRAGSKRRCCHAIRSATTCSRSSRSTGAPGGRTCAGCSSPAGCGAPWAGCSTKSAPASSSAPEATPPARWCGARYATPGRVVIRGFFDPMTVPYRAADVVVGRAGAMTVAELCAWGKPSILVPLPSAAADHQTNNARALADAGAAILLAERDLTAYSLANQVEQLLGDRTRLESIAARARARGNPNASRDIVSKILTVVA